MEGKGDGAATGGGGGRGGQRARVAQWRPGRQLLGACQKWAAGSALQVAAAGRRAWERSEARYSRRTRLACAAPDHCSAATCTVPASAGVGWHEDLTGREEGLQRSLAWMLNQAAAHSTAPQAAA